VAEEMVIEARQAPGQSTGRGHFARLDPPGWRSTCTPSIGQVLSKAFPTTLQRPSRFFGAATRRSGRRQTDHHRYRADLSTNESVDGDLREFKGTGSEIRLDAL
jgi:transcription termination factor Rho